MKSKIILLAIIIMLAMPCRIFAAEDKMTSVTGSTESVSGEKSFKLFFDRGHFRYRVCLEGLG